MSDKYILDDDGNPVECHDIIKWSIWFNDSNKRRVAISRFIVNGTKVMISTVFIGLDHNFFSSGRPILWETMIFGGEHNDYQTRYSSKEEALVGHQEAVKLATTGYDSVVWVEE